MAIMNFTTQIQTEKTFAEIQSMLVQAKAQAVLSEYDDDRVLSAISFRISTDAGVLSFRLPLNIDGVHKHLINNPKVPAKLKSRDQAARVSIRIVKDWIKAQMAFIEAEQATLTEVFLPYAQDGEGMTVYEKMSSTNFKNLQISG